MVGHLSPPPAPLPVAGAGAPSTVAAAAAGAAVAPAPVGLRVKSRLKSSERGAPRLLPPLGDDEEEGGPLTKPERPVRRLVRKWQVQSINNQSTSIDTRGRERAQHVRRCSMSSRMRRILLRLLPPPAWSCCCWWWGDSAGGGLAARNPSEATSWWLLRLLEGESGVSEKGLFRCGAGCGSAPAPAPAPPAPAANKSFRFSPPNGRLVGRAGRLSPSASGPVLMRRVGGDEPRARETEAGRPLLGSGEGGLDVSMGGGDSEAGSLLPIVISCAGGGDGAGAAAAAVVAAAVGGGRGFCSAALVGEVGAVSFPLPAAADVAAVAERGL